PGAIIRGRPWLPISVPVPASTTAPERCEPRRLPRATADGVITTMSPHPHQVDIARTIDAVWRMESARVIGSLPRILRGVGLAEDALVAALEKWPVDGVPDNPGAWLTTTARNRAIDRLRHLRLREEKHVQVAWELEQLQEDVSAREEQLLDDTVGDDVLRLMF